MEVKFFDSKLENFLSGLEKLTIAKVVRTVELLKESGHQLGMPHSKYIGHRLFELRVRGDQEVRIFYTFYLNLVMLLHGYVKKSQRIPSKELDIAHQKLEALDR